MHKINDPDQIENAIIQLMKWFEANDYSPKDSIAIGMSFIATMWHRGGIDKKEVKKGLKVIEKIFNNFRK